jgi:hypothetical protein
MLKGLDGLSPTDRSSLYRLPACLYFVFLGGVPRPTRGGGVVDDQDVRRQIACMPEGSFRLWHLMQAELEQHDIAGRPDREKVALHKRKSVGQTTLADSCGKLLDGSLVPIDGDHSTSRPGLLDQLAAACPNINHGSAREIVERGQVRDDLPDIRRHD